MKPNTNAADIRADILAIARAADVLDAGIEHFEKTGETMSSPSFIQKCVDSPKMAVNLIHTFLSELKADQALMRMLWDDNLVASVERVLEDLRATAREG